MAEREEEVVGSERIELSEEQWRQRLSPEQYRVLRERDTDHPFKGEFTHPGHDGTFRCAACGRELFSSETQFDSGSGWPSFTEPIDGAAVEETPDHSLGTERTEVTCARCGGHLGHVFDDGPQPTGLRYCINSTAISLAEKEK